MCIFAQIDVLIDSSFDLNLTKLASERQMERYGCQVIHQSYFLEYAVLLLPLSPGYSTVLSLSLSVSCVTCPLSMQFGQFLVVSY